MVHTLEQVSRANETDVVVPHDRPRSVFIGYLKGVLVHSCKSVLELTGKKPRKITVAVQ